MTTHYRAILIGLDLRLDELDDFGTEIARLAISDASRIRYATIVGAIAVADTREAHE